MLLSDYLVIAVYALTYVFCVISVLVVSTSPMFQGHFCEAVAWTSLGSASAVKFGLTLLLIEKVKTIFNSSTSRWKDIDYLCNCVAGLAPNLLVFGWLAATMDTLVVPNYCYVRVPEMIEITSLCHNIVFVTYLTYRYAAHLIRTKHKDLRHRTVRLVIGSCLSLLSLTVSCSLLVMTGALQHGYMWLISGLALAVVLSIVIQYTIAWDPIYRRDATYSMQASGSCRCMYNKAAKNAQSIFSAWDPPTSHVTSSRAFTREPSKVAASNFILSTDHIAEIWSALDELEEENSTADVKSDGTEVLEIRPQASETRRADLYTVDTPKLSPTSEESTIDFMRV